MNYLSTNGPAIAAWAGVIVLSLAWVIAVDLAVAYIIRIIRHRQLIVRMNAVLKRKIS